jgi:uncharacterized protein (TIGR03066 family)
MPARRIAVLAVVALLSAAGVVRAEDKPQQLILGRWEPVDGKDKAVVEFLKDGKLKISSRDVTLEGSYKFIDDKTLEVKVVFGGNEQAPSRLTVTVTKDELTTEEAGKGKKERFKRVP